MLETLVASAKALCAADVGQIYLVDGRQFRLARTSGVSQDYIAFMEQHPIQLDRGSLIGRTALGRVVEQIADVLADAEYARPEAQRLAGFRTIIGAPMLAGDDLVGVLSVWRTEVEPFDEMEASVLASFAAQAASAVRNAELMTTLRSRTAELAQKVDQLEALAELNQAVSRSLDIDEVLETVIERAVDASGTDAGSIFVFDETTGEFVLRTAYATPDDLVTELRGIRIHLDATLVGRSALAGHPMLVPDIALVERDAHLEALHRHGWHAVLVVPMVRPGSIVGALVVRRKTPGSIPEATVDLMQTFATQSALSIANARLFREIAEKTDQLEVASRHKSEFLASMSHELRTPLNAVIGFSDVLLDRMFGDLNDKQDEYLRDIRASGQHLLELLNEILDLSKVEAGRLDLDLAPVALPTLIESCVQMVRDRADRSGVQVSVTIEARTPDAHADQLRLKQVVLNLLTNAVKFTPSGGRIEIAVAPAGSDVQVSVRDTGPGIAPADQERIFESFQQGSRGPAKEEGTGLGLTLSRRLAELQGGRLWLVSEPGAGSTFFLTVPAVAGARAVEGPDAERTGETPAAGPGPLVVVVEDDRSSVELLRLYLAGTGARVVTARDGARGVSTVRRLRPHCVVLDIRLPAMDGWEVLRQLKAAPDTADIPVIVVSILDERGRGFALGAAEYLVKPVSREQVQAAFRKVTAPAGQGVVLSIGDDPFAVDLIRSVLEPQGWAVLSAPDGPTGHDLARRHRPAAVVLDLAMPDGLAVIAQLREDPETRHVPVVVLSAATLADADRERLRGQLVHVAGTAQLEPWLLADLVRAAAGQQTASAHGGTP
jgi:signal transduction histidine kinase/DNA-binding response OmpR family regulator